jgi:transposase-like protein/rubredoxin
LKQHLDLQSFDTKYISSITLQNIELLRLEDDNSSSNLELLYLENTWLKKLLVLLIQLLIGRCIVFPQKLPKENIPEYHPTRKIGIDTVPIFEDPKIFDHKVLLEQYHLEHGKPMKPIAPNKDRKLNFKDTCPVCGVSHHYIYENNIARQQMLCKVCHQTFTIHKPRSESLKIKCPHCARTLERIKGRCDFSIFKCKNDSCDFYLKNLEKLKGLSVFEQEQRQQNKHMIKLRYIYRAFDIELKQVAHEVRKKLDMPVDLSRIRNAQHILGLAMTYYVNYGLSSRKTAAIMHDIHQVDISHQTIVNYAQSVAATLKNFVEEYPYELSSELCGDETYVKVRKKNHYVFFVSDKEKKIITSYQVFKNRDTLAAIKTIYQTLQKYPELPDNLRLIVDGNPIYQLAQIFFSNKGIPFELIQVIGLKNTTETDRLFRPYKQCTERLNRSFKQESYLTMNGFNSLEKANGYLLLFTACFNFLRPHTALGHQVPIEIPELQKCATMPEKWLKLLKLSYNHLAA